MIESLPRALADICGTRNLAQPRGSGFPFVFAGLTVEVHARTRHLASRHRACGSEKGSANDLDIVYTAAKNGTNGHAVTQIRNGRTRIDVEYSDSALRDAADPLRVLRAVASPEFFHELHHYIFYRPVLSDSGFVMEGEATAYGEITRRGAQAGMSESSERLRRDIWTELFSGTTGATADRRIGELNDRMTLATRDMPPTRTECALLAEVNAQVERTKSLDLERLMTLTPLMFHDGGPQSQIARYAAPWAVYAADFIERFGWAERLGAVAVKRRRLESVSAEDGAFLAEVDAKTRAWVKKQSGVWRPRCR